MPLPKPRRGEEKNKYVGRCISFVKHEGSTRLKTDAQIQAACIAQYDRFKFHEKQLQLHTHPTFKALGNAMIIEGDLLKPGTFIGLDGVPTHYSKEFIAKVKESIVGKPIKFAHAISPTSMSPEIPKGMTIGFWSKVKRGQTLKVRGYTFFPPAIAYLRSHPDIGLSMEADVSTVFNESLGIESAQDGTLTGGVLINDPACPTCKVTSTREINLESSRQKKRDALSETTDTTEKKDAFLEYKDDIEDKELAVTRTAFFDWLKKQLEAAGIKEDLIPKVLTILQKAIKTPYPYPSPEKATEMALQIYEELTKDTDLKKLQDRAEFMKTCLVEKSMEECSKEWREKHAEAEPPEVPPPPGTPLSAKEKELTEKLGKATAELEALKKVTDFQMKEDVKKLEGEIKMYDETFELPKLLEGVECPVTQKKMLQKYLEVLKKRVKPIKLQLGETAAHEQVKRVTEGMFGDGVTFESMFGVETKEED